MKRGLFLFSVFFVSWTVLSAQQVVFLPFYLNSSIYGNKDKKSLEADVYMKSGLRVETNPFVYFDLSLDLNIKKLPSFFHILPEKRTAGDFKFLNASLNFPNLGSKYLSLALFWGKYDELGSETIMNEYVKRRLIPSEFRKFYPASVFKPNTDVEGMGFALYGAGSSGFYGGIYSYWNNKTGKDFAYANDLRFGGYADYFVFDFFAGFSAKRNLRDSKLRFGITGFLEAEEYGIYFEGGLAEFKLIGVNSKVLQSRFYVLFEPRVRKKIFNGAFSFFMSPIFNVPDSFKTGNTDNSALVGLNSLFGFGDLDVYGLNGGFSVLTTLDMKNISNVTPFSLSVSPFITARIGKVELDARLPLNPLKYKDLLRAVIVQFSIKAVY